MPENSSEIKVEVKSDLRDSLSHPKLKEDAIKDTLSELSTITVSPNHDSTKTNKTKGSEISSESKNNIERDDIGQVNSHPNITNKIGSNNEALSVTSNGQNAVKDQFSKKSNQESFPAQQVDNFSNVQFHKTKHDFRITEAQQTNQTTNNWESDQNKTNDTTRANHISAIYTPNWTNDNHLEELSKYNPKVFTINKQKSTPEEYKLKLELTNTDWIFWFIVGSLVVFTWLKVFFSKSITATLIASYNPQVTNRLFREKNSLSSKISMALNILFGFNASIFFYQLISQFQLISIPTSGYWLTLAIFVAIVIIYASKEICLRIIGFVADISLPISEYLHIVGIYNKCIGILLYPIIIGIQYSQTDLISRETILYVGLFLFTTTYLIRLIRGIIISIRSNLSIFYAILYLCALEIAPNAILYVIATSLF